VGCTWWPNTRTFGSKTGGEVTNVETGKTGGRPSLRRSISGERSRTQNTKARQRIVEGMVRTQGVNPEGKALKETANQSVKLTRYANRIWAEIKMRTEKGDENDLGPWGEVGKPGYYAGTLSTGRQELLP